MWTAEAARQFGYREATILNAGFAGETLDMEKVEWATFAPAAGDPPILVAYMRAIMVRQGDALQLRLTDPKGAVLAETTTPPMASSRAQQLQFIGKRRPAAGWPKGEYRAELRVMRNGRAIAEKRVQTRL
ncbi:hypothetical protein LRS10_16080 [Phenylobacterium sp. J426]|uniref:hypothetical protein n=1 Tax=Phenylobacterium sp. J426 TaxID=2898439 RepID=UPI002151AE7A|nr:hypothetical protein [Phenylobacterium sp. J426]MCR5875561.1 hypothetical protein [Phenylobacterium sp. J426]